MLRAYGLIAFDLIILPMGKICEYQECLAIIIAVVAAVKEISLKMG